MLSAGGLGEQDVPSPARPASSAKSTPATVISPGSRPSSTTPTAASATHTRSRSRREKDSAIDAGIFDGSLITVDRSLRPRDGDPVVVDANGERSVKIFRLVGGRSWLAFGNCRYPDYDPGPDADIEIFGVITNSVRRFRR